MALMFRALVMAGALSGTTMIAAPAAAAPLPALGAPSAAILAHSRFDPNAANADWGCRWGCGWGRGWGRGWGGGWGRRGWRRNRIDGGDVLIGAAIIGGAIAIANSTRRRERERDVVIVDREVRNTDWRYDDRRIEDRRASPRGTGASGLDNAVNQCLDRIERDVRVDSVDDVSRTGAGWRVNGVLFSGAPFECRIGNNGQIDAIDYGDGFRSGGLAPAPADGQWDADRYAGARAALGGTVRPDMAVQEAQMQPGAAPVRVATAPANAAALPAYPGGPIPGEVIPDEAPMLVDGDL
jgi:hypothetical protein